MFRLIPFVIASVNGLAAYSVIWLIWHPFENIVQGIDTLPLVFSTTLCFIQVPICIKIWRSKYWWVAFILHAAVNNWMVMCNYVFGLSY